VEWVKKSLPSDEMTIEKLKKDIELIKEIIERF
jgi:hypothetical protein